jgi:hypothetical protein
MPRARGRSKRRAAARWGPVISETNTLLSSLSSRSPHLAAVSPLNLVRKKLRSLLKAKPGRRRRRSTAAAKMFLTRYVIRHCQPRFDLWGGVSGGGGGARADFSVCFWWAQDGVRPRGEHLLAGGAAVPGRVRHRGHQGEVSLPSVPTGIWASCADWCVVCREEASFVRFEVSFGEKIWSWYLGS